MPNPKHIRGGRSGDVPVGLQQRTRPLPSHTERLEAMAPMRIGELAQKVGVDTPTIRYYESVGVLPEPNRNAVGHRTYSSTDLGQLRFVVSARSLGLSLDDIRETLAIRSSGETPCTYVRQLIVREVEAVKIKIRQLQALARELDALQELSLTVPDTSVAEPCICHIIEAARSDEAVPGSV